MKLVTVTLTWSQINCIENGLYAIKPRAHDPHKKEEDAFIRRILTTLAKAKTEAIS